MPYLDHHNVYVCSLNIVRTTQLTCNCVSSQGYFVVQLYGGELKAALHPLRLTRSNLSVTRLKRHMLVVPGFVVSGWMPFLTKSHQIIIGYLLHSGLWYVLHTIVRRRI